MKITLLTVGKIKEKYLRDAIDEYSKRLGKFCKLNIVEVKDEETKQSPSQSEIEEVKNKEGRRLMEYIDDKAYVCGLFINSKEYSSEEFAHIMRDDIRYTICESLKNMGFSYVSLDMTGYRTGSLNEVL